MKKLLTGLMLATASFMLLFTVSYNKTYAVDHQETFTLTKDPDFDYNIDLYGFLEYAFANIDANLPDGTMHTSLEVQISVLTYEYSGVSKDINGYYYLTFGTTQVNQYRIKITNNTITSELDQIPDGVYTLDFFLPYPSYEDLFFQISEEKYQSVVAGANDEVFPGEWYVVADGAGNVYQFLQDNYGHYEVGTYEPVIFELYMGNKDYDLVENGIVQIFENEYYTYYLIQSPSCEIGVYPDHLRVGAESTQLPQEGQTIDLIVVNKTVLPWTQSHSYGRIRSNESTLYLNQPSDTAAFLSHSTSTNVINVNNIAVGDEIVMQSPYSNFSVSYGVLGQPRQVLVTQENVAAIRMIKNNVDNTNYSFDIWYWTTGGALEFRRQENVNLANRNSLNISFNGGVRKAIDYIDVMVANVDVLTPLEDFLPNLVAWDAIDGDISDEIYIVDDGGYDPAVVNVYNVEFGVTNSNGLESTVITPVHVVDIVAPVISGDNSLLQIGYNANFNVAAWVASLTVSDNYYTGLTISLVNDTYTANKTKLGTYEVKVRSVDLSGNETFFIRPIEVIDEVGPVVTGITTITASINENLTAEQIKMSLAASDEIDGNVTNSITIYSDGLAGNSSTPGTYEVVYMAVDAAGNQTFYTVTATIVTSPPGFYLLNSNSIRLLPGATLTIQQILDILGASGATNVSTNYDANTPGVYNLSFTLGDEDYEISVTVLGVNDPILPEPVIPSDSTNFNSILIVLGAVAGLGLLVLFIKKKK